MRTLARMLVLCLVVPAGVTLAQDKPAQEKPAVTPENPLSASVQNTAFNGPTPGKFSREIGDFLKMTRHRKPEMPALSR